MRYNLPLICPIIDCYYEFTDYKFELDLGFTKLKNNN